MIGKIWDEEKLDINNKEEGVDNKSDLNNNEKIWSNEEIKNLFKSTDFLENKFDITNLVFASKDILIDKKSDYSLRSRYWWKWVYRLALVDKKWEHIKQTKEVKIKFIDPETNLISPVVTFEKWKLMFGGKESPSFKISLKNKIIAEITELDEKYSKYIETWIYADWQKVLLDSNSDYLIKSLSNWEKSQEIELFDKNWKAILDTRDVKFDFSEPTEEEKQIKTFSFIDWFCDIEQVKKIGIERVTKEDFEEVKIYNAKNEWLDIKNKFEDVVFLRITKVQKKFWKLWNKIIVE